MNDDNADVSLQTTEKKGSALLFSLLENRDEETFSQRCAENRDQLDELHEKYRDSCLYHASRYGMSKAVKALLENGADPNNNYVYDYSPIMWAALGGYYDIVEMLARHKKVCLKGASKGTVLHALLKCNRKHKDPGLENCVKFVLEQRPWRSSLDVNAKDSLGVTALDEATINKQKRIIFLLLEHGAYIGLGSYKGYNMTMKFMEA